MKNHKYKDDYEIAKKIEVNAEQEELEDELDKIIEAGKRPEIIITDIIKDMKIHPKNKEHSIGHETGYEKQKRSYGELALWLMAVALFIWGVFLVWVYL